MVGNTVYTYHSAPVFCHYCGYDSVEVEAVHIMESRETVSCGEDNVVEGKDFTHEETFPKGMINIPVDKEPMLTHWCGSALSEACRTEGMMLLRPAAHAAGCTDIAPPVLLGRDALGSHSSRSGLYRHRTSGAPLGEALGVPQLAQWVVQRPHLRCSVGRRFRSPAVCAVGCTDRCLEGDL